MLNLIFKESGRTKVRMIMEPDSDVGLVAAKVVKEGKSDLSRRCILTTSVGHNSRIILVGDVVMCNNV